MREQEWRNVPGSQAPSPKAAVEDRPKEEISQPETGPGLAGTHLKTQRETFCLLRSFQEAVSSMLQETADVSKRGLPGKPYQIVDRESSRLGQGAHKHPSRWGWWSRGRPWRRSGNVPELPWGKLRLWGIRIWSSTKGGSISKSLRMLGLSPEVFWDPCIWLRPRLRWSQGARTACIAALGGQSTTTP